jgi:hypothetical protein
MQKKQPHSAKVHMRLFFSLVLYFANGTGKIGLLGFFVAQVMAKTG